MSMKSSSTFFAKGPQRKSSPFAKQTSKSSFTGPAKPKNNKIASKVGNVSTPAKESSQLAKGRAPPKPKGSSPLTSKSAPSTLISSDSSTDQALKGSKAPSAKDEKEEDSFYFTGSDALTFQYVKDSTGKFVRGPELTSGIVNAEKKGSSSFSPTKGESSLNPKTKGTFDSSKKEKASISKASEYKKGQTKDMPSLSFRTKSKKGSSTLDQKGETADLSEQKMSGSTQKMPTPTEAGEDSADAEIEKLLKMKQATTKKKVGTITKSSNQKSTFAKKLESPKSGSKSEGKQGIPSFNPASKTTKGSSPFAKKGNSPFKGAFKSGKNPTEAEASTNGESKSEGKQGMPSFSPASKTTKGSNPFAKRVEPISNKSPGDTERPLPSSKPKSTVTKASLNQSEAGSSLKAKPSQDKGDVSKSGSKTSLQSFGSSSKPLETSLPASDSSNGELPDIVSTSSDSLTSELEESELSGDVLESTLAPSVLDEGTIVDESSTGQPFYEKPFNPHEMVDTDESVAKYSTSNGEWWAPKSLPRKDPVSFNPHGMVDSDDSSNQSSTNGGEGSTTNSKSQGQSLNSDSTKATEAETDSLVEKTEAKSKSSEGLNEPAESQDPDDKDSSWYNKPIDMDFFK